MLLGLIISIIASHVSYLYNPSMMDYGVCVCVLSGTNLSLILYTRRYFFVNTFAKKKEKEIFKRLFCFFCHIIIRDNSLHANNTRIFM